MNYKQQIEQKAREYANSQFKKGYVEGKPNFTCVDLDFAYRAGAEAAIEIANTWIPIGERLPENKDIVLVRTNNECVMTAYLHGKESGFICYGDDAYDGVGVVTHWKPITL